jgi:hypothetical protein
MHQWVEFRSGFGRSPRKVVIQANRSGFLYVLDAKDASSLRQRLRQDQLGERHRPPDRDRRLQGGTRRQERHRQAVDLGRDQLI